MHTFCKDIWSHAPSTQHIYTYTNLGELICKDRSIHDFDMTKYLYVICIDFHIFKVYICFLDWFICEWNLLNYYLSQKFKLIKKHKPNS